MTKETGIVLIHGAGLQASIWDQLRNEVKNPVLAIDFPKNGTDNKTTNQLTFEDYVDFATQQIRKWDHDDFVIVAHSIGACVGLKIANHFSHKLRGFVAVASVIPLNENSFVSSLPFPQRMIMPMILKLFGTKPPKKSIEEELCNDLTTHQASKIVAEFTPESKALYLTRISFKLPETNRLYIKLMNDKSMPDALQDKMAEHLKAHEVVVLESGHLPMISKPKQLAEIVLDFVNIVPRIRQVVKN